MVIRFEKYHGAGNDFVMIDSRGLNGEMFGEELVARLCDRHYGIGGDGLILLLNDSLTDFRMKYFNADGKEGTMCGNGGRCIAAFARALGIVKNRTTFSGIDGMHDAFFSDDGLVHLRMNVTSGYQKLEDGYLLHTGSPHLVLFRKDIDKIDVFSEGRMLRNDERFLPAGVNVNFVEVLGSDSFKIRTYERGVEDETLACGTGSVASAIASFLSLDNGNTKWKVSAAGGDLEVSFIHIGEDFREIWLTGDAVKVFTGDIEI